MHEFDVIEGNLEIPSKGKVRLYATKAGFVSCDANGNLVGPLGSGGEETDPVFAASEAAEFEAGDKANLDELSGGGETALHSHAGGGGASYLVYTALLYLFAGSEDTIAVTVLENTIGNIAWGCADPSFFTATLVGAFPVGRTVVLTSGGSVPVGGEFSAARYDNDYVHVRGYLSTVDALPISIEIRVYPSA